MANEVRLILANFRERRMSTDGLLGTTPYRRTRGDSCLMVGRPFLPDHVTPLRLPSDR